MTPRTQLLLVTGGGTGGHVFPGLAVARSLRRFADVDVLFAGSPRGLEARVVPEHGYELELLDVEPMKGGGPQRAIRGALVAAKAMQRARTIVRRRRPAAVLSVGGYAAGPAALACVAQRVPLAILEPNSILGLTNRLLAPFAKRAYVAWPDAGRHFRGAKTRLYGVPLRPGFEPRAYEVSPGPGPRRVLVLGGSQGAQALNDLIPRVVARISGEGRVQLSIVHQAGRDRDHDVREAYGKGGLPSSTTVEVAPFLEDVAARIAAADLVIARSGAVTVAELSAIGRAAVFIPFPYAADDHQAKNALSLAEMGGAVCIREEAATVERLASEVASLLGDDARRARMANVAREHGRPHAAEDVARDLLELAGIPIRRDGVHATDGTRTPKQNGATNGTSAHFRADGHDRKDLS
jgi:UDP-N-acetylglucosamine--N-acetylmuramyl-(pentapeptide) pyrophosphoryl-undecaprenol N-acetylglucosamine transferase